MNINVKRYLFPLLCVVFITSCAAFVYLHRNAAPTYVEFASNMNQSGEYDGKGGHQEGSDADSDAESDAEFTPLNINRATLDELTALRGIGPALGQRIIDFREEHGDFKSVEELLQVQGIGERVLGGIKEFIVVE
ncbi:MAG: ComEA family DNA-binding protein [Oscillospiraceae bacterium]|nr:ComEA family DNA-binding protein [Oscillospiraceae bacterium]